jgi:mRNA interferase RelE/StbE
MAFRITFAPEARDDYDDLPAFHRASVRDAINIHLAYQPARLSRSRIKRLRDMRKPQFRLRVGDVRVFYDVAGDEVRVLGIVFKPDADKWLRRWGESL